MKNRLIYILSALFLFIGAAGCTDEIFTDEPVGEGISSLSAEITFSPIVGAFPASRAADDTYGTPGDAIRTIRTFSLFIYTDRSQDDSDPDDVDNTKKLERYIPYSELENMGLTWTHNENMPSDYIPAENSPYVDTSNNNTAHQAEEKTPKANFTIDKLPFGKYYIYAVANVDELDELTEQEIEARFDNPENLKVYPLVWKEDKIGSNDQMFGYFTLQTTQTSTGFNAPQITVNKSRMAIHSWLKRAASKVTVVVDGSDLYPGVQVWIKSIQVKDIPDMCFLGKDNVAPAHLIEQGQKIVVSEGDNADGDNADNLVSNQSDFTTFPRDAEAAHSQTAGALFFYENMQGEGQLKTQVWPDQGPNPETPKYPEGNSPGDKGYKDSKIAGTYVEVIGYYKNNGVPYPEQDPHYPKDKESEGPIIYRFMLGKNVTTNYDAQRNHHFKLTLKLRHNANDNDWHIVYDQDPEIIARSPYYISYLYNQTMNYPIKIVGGELMGLKAEIPYDEVTKRSWAPKDGEVTQADIAAAAALGGKVFWPTDDIDDPGPWNGFLSLRKTEVAQFGVWPATKPDGTKDEEYNPNSPTTYSYNRTYYEANNRGSRTYKVAVGEHQDADGNYMIEKTAPGEYNVEIPLYTRARVMVSQTAYSGNNPYAAYNRESKVRVTAIIKKFNGEEVEKSVDLQIIQGRRVLNPKAIWRKATSREEFHVQLKILPYQQASEFTNLVSDGPWRAVVDDNCKSWVEIYPTENESQRSADGSITGLRDPFSEDNIIDFWYRPKSTTTEPRGGIIRVYYNNYTCVHTIFVRQGYDPVSFYGSNVMWHTYNLRTGGYNGEIAEEAPDPEVEGAYFRQYNRQYPIDSRSNTLEEFHKNGMDRDFLIAKSGTATATMKWNDIRTSATSWGTFKVKINGKIIENCRLPKPEDWEHIVGTQNNPRLTTVYGFGVLYGDNAKETLEDIQLVYGATPGDHNSGRGMRGVIVCDESSGTQIFLPIAASGYGRFKQYSSKDRYNRLPAREGGVIQYANRYTWYPSTKNTLGVTDYPVQYHPLFYDLWMSEGTYYWLEGPRSLDINFYTLDIATAEENQDGLGLVWGPGTEWAGGPDPSGSDAVHIRLVHDKE